MLAIPGCILLHDLESFLTMPQFTPKSRLLLLGISALVLVTTTWALPVHASDLTCDTAEGPSAVGCYAIASLIFFLDVGVKAVDSVVDKVTPYHTLTAVVNEGTPILSIKLKGPNHHNYVEKPRGREIPMQLKCVINPASKDGGIQKTFDYGYCEELRSRVENNARNLWNQMSYEPLVRFGVDSDGRANPAEAELDVMLDIKNLPISLLSSPTAEE